MWEGHYKILQLLIIDDKNYHKFKYTLSNEGFTKNTLHLFLSGCLYLGNGQADRPFMHIKEAMDSKNKADKHGNNETYMF